MVADGAALDADARRAAVHPAARRSASLWRWLLRLRRALQPARLASAARAQRRAAQRLARAPGATGSATYALDCEFVESGEDYVFRDARAHSRTTTPKRRLLRELGVQVEVIDGPAYEALEPALKPGVAGAIRFAGDAALRPDRYVDELARVVREKGGEIVEGLRAAVHRTRRRCMARAHVHRHVSRARRRAARSGAWSPRLADAIGLAGLRGAMQPGKGYSITYDPPALRAEAAAGAARTLGLRDRVGQRLPPRQHDGVLRLRRHAQRAPPGRARTRRRANTCTNRSARRCASTGSAGGR